MKNWTKGDMMAFAFIVMALVTLYLLLRRMA